LTLLTPNFTAKVAAIGIDAAVALLPAMAVVNRSALS